MSRKDSSSEDPPPSVRRVSEAEADRVTELFTLAFYNDPTWSWAFPDPDKRMDHHRALWGLFMHSALPYGRVWMTDDGGAAALWIPPGKPELSEADEARVEPLLRELIGSHADDVLTLLDNFDTNHPRHQPHYYLSLVGTHPDHRGHGKGMGLLAANLVAIDELGLPAYLESSNRSNDHRYERLGFQQVGEFAAPDGGPTVACMWRDPAPLRTSLKLKAAQGGESPGGGVATAVVDGGRWREDERAGQWFPITGVIVYFHVPGLHKVTDRGGTGQWVRVARPGARSAERVGDPAKAHQRQHRHQRRTRSSLPRDRRLRHDGFASSCAAGNGLSPRPRLGTGR